MTMYSASNLKQHSTPTSVRPARFSRMKALSVAVFVFTLPNMVLIPTTSTSSELNAANIAMASSAGRTAG